MPQEAHKMLSDLARNEGLSDATQDLIRYIIQVAYHEGKVEVYNQFMKKYE